MSLKLKVLGLGLLAVMATSAFAAVNASATTNGHFTAELPAPPAGQEHHLIVKGTETVNTSHRLTFYEVRNEPGHPTVDPNNGIECTHAAYHGALKGAQATTTQSVQVRPAYTQCRTKTDSAGSHPVTVHVPAGCGTNVFEFKSGTGGTVNLNCEITITHPNCDIKVTSGQKLSGITYTTTTENTKHALTMNVNVKTIVGHYESGFCIFLGKTHLFEMVGSVTVWAENTAGGRVGITHT